MDEEEEGKQASSAAHARTQASKRAEASPKKKQTSKTEYVEDASALKAEEGRGDRRNVQGELHASDEP